ncbi:MAG: prepilin-type N-terminal cleavage/methylation domain-containing protein [Desulfobacterales bacterium]|nr:prepilin-type N-terminal cleavage/methylation domain-containing protein [Desulfobacterales bacterium]
MLLPASSRKGFTLIELLISMAITSIVMSGIILSVSIQQKLHGKQSGLLELQSNMRSCLDMIALEIMMAGFDKKKTANSGIENASADIFSFTSDLNINGFIDEPNETVKFYVKNNKLIKATTNKTKPPPYMPVNLTVSDNITGISFRYFERDKTTPMADPDSNRSIIRNVEISITGRIPDRIVYGGGRTKTLTTEVRIRNMAEF